MSLNDLLHAEERGRWWVVGSAFQPDFERRNGTFYCNLVSRHHLPLSYFLVEQKKQEDRGVSFSADVVELARRAGMNTEVRKKIFCSIGENF